jgi:glucose-1-phosphate thymidylyltransferase
MSEVVGLIPAAGQAKRISPLPCSKELYPVGFWHSHDEKDGRPKVACHYLLEKMRSAGIAKTYIVLRNGKWDIPSYLEDGASIGMHIAYLMLGVPYGVPFTLDQAYPFVKDSIVAFGFPDIIFQPDDAFTQLLSYQRITSADVVLGLFPVHRPETMDMVEVDDGGHVRSLLIKPIRSNLQYGWVLAVWSPVFTHFMHERLAGRQHQYQIQDRTCGQGELTVGDILKAAIEAKLRIEAVIFPNSTYLDIGTPEGLLKAIQNVK